MIILTSLVGLFSAAVALAHPLASVDSTTIELGRRTIIGIDPPGTGTTPGGAFYYVSHNSSSGLTMDLGTVNYILQWNTAAQQFIGGIGRNPGNTNPITYSGTFNPVGNAYLSVYGLTMNPMVEYRICDRFGSYNPSTGYTYMGNVSSDGSTYDIYKGVGVPFPNPGLLYNQYISVRQSQRVGGTVTLANHFKAWQSLGMTLGYFTYQIVATEGYLSSGSSQISLQF